MKTTPTSILDACCGGRMFYFEKNHPNILYIDRRCETVEMKDRDKIRTLEINPDFVMDFTDIKFPDECFNFVVFDPPHLINKNGAICSLCDKPIETMKDCTIDHIIPISKGGLTTIENCQLAHRSCNISKGNRED